MQLLIQIWFALIAQIMQAKLDAVKKLTGCNAEIVFVPSGEEGLALVAADIQRFSLLLVRAHLHPLVGVSRLTSCLTHEYRSTSIC